MLGLPRDAAVRGDGGGSTLARERGEVDVEDFSSAGLGSSCCISTTS